MTYRRMMERKHGSSTSSEQVELVLKHIKTNCTDLMFINAKCTKQQVLVTAHRRYCNLMITKPHKTVYICPPRPSALLPRISVPSAARSQVSVCLSRGSWSSSTDLKDDVHC